MAVATIKVGANTNEADPSLGAADLLLDPVDPDELEAGLSVSCAEALLVGVGVGELVLSVDVDGDEFVLVVGVGDGEVPAVGSDETPSHEAMTRSVVWR